MQRVGSAYAVSAGGLAATASVFGKLGGAASSNSQTPLWQVSCYAGLILVSMINVREGAPYAVCDVP